MSGSWRHKCLLLSLVLVFFVLSEASRLPSWEQMMPKKLPSPSSSPSKGTNSASTSSSKAIETERNHPSSDGKVTEEVTIWNLNSGRYVKWPVLKT
ncbi:hypothetical protein Acr_21g0004690 [Actinidia rufa]|uniref:Uncharacterized protein n=1 Tax=Actinidia rufa TaxID=165716 RepID=A0A7J0GGB8_9ERIC|nr:hypothetical protein Acr_21g0004690 [Actinidia rufa]